MESVYNISKRVEQILEVNKDARNNDDKLYMIVCDEILKAQGINIDILGYKEGHLMREYYGLPKLDTVGRVRRGVQKRRPELRATDEVKGFRQKREAEFLNYAKGLN